MGSRCDTSSRREIHVSVTGCSDLDYIDVLHNNKVIHRVNGAFTSKDLYLYPVKVRIELGWARNEFETEWAVHLAVEQGELLGIEPHFQGYKILEPQGSNKRIYVFSKSERKDRNQFQIETQTWAEVVQGFTLTLQASPETNLRGIYNGKGFNILLFQLEQGARAEYLSGFLSPAILFHPIVPRGAYELDFNFFHKNISKKQDWYYVRVRQKNNQYAWSSPIWVD